MRTAILVMCATLIAGTTAHSQQTQSDASTNTHATTPIAGVDDAALAGSDRSIGQIEDVLVDLDHATVTAVILSVGGFLGIGDKLVAVPVGQLKVGAEARFTTDLTKDQLTSAPAFDFGRLK